jgi:hypothetical protein
MKRYDLVFLVAAVLLLVNLFVRFVDQSQMMWMFPFDFVNDWSSYMTQLHFLKECGFHNFCGFWYNGFTSFLLIAPGWFLSMYPLYLVIGNVQVVAYLSLIGTYVGFFLLFFYFGKKFKFSFVQRLFWFAFFTGHAIAVGNFIRLGRIHEFFALFWLTFLLMVLLWYKGRKLDWKFLSVVPLYTMAFLSHQTVAVLASVSLLGFVVFRKFKDWVYVVGCFVLSLLLSSFWLVPYMKSFSSSYGVDIVLTVDQLVFTPEFFLQNLASFVIPFVLLFVFVVYVVTNRYSFRNELKFYWPVVLLAFLMFTRIVSYLPVLKYVYPDTYNYFFMFFILYLFLKVRFRNLNELFLKSLLIGVVVVAIVSVLFSFLYTPFFVEHTSQDLKTMDVMSEVDGIYMVYFSESYAEAYYSYGAIQGLSTASGWYSIPDPEYKKVLEEYSITALQYGDCELFSENMDYLNVTEVITYGEHCDTMYSCGYQEKYKNEEVCLYLI